MQQILKAGVSHQFNEYVLSGRPSDKGAVAFWLYTRLRLTDINDETGNLG
jgi:hypothetical protein